MLVDVFLYNGESDMAALRLAALGPHVDLQVAVVCDLTHQSDPNPLPEPLDCAQVCIPAVPIPEGRGGQGSRYYQWIERQHRNGARAVVDLFDLGASDVVMVSDVDEIPDPVTLDQLDQPGPVAVPMRMHGFALNYLYPTGWVGTTASRACDMAPQAHRDWRYHLPHKGAGWHLSWFGDIAEKERKLRSFSHAELQGLDVEACWREARHANGEPLTHLTRDETAGLDWPPPLFDDFTIPPSWWAPEG